MRILFEDYHCIAVSKPAGILTQGVLEGIPTVESRVKAYIKERYAKPRGVYLGIPHRLDRPVSGVILFARNTKAARRIHEQFQTRRVQKVYWAIVEGEVQPDQGIWEDWLRKLPDEARAEVVPPGTEGAKLAETEYRVLRRLGSRATWLELYPRTGRMHQLRVQSAVRGHPIMGDQLYGSPSSFGPSSGTPGEAVIALHARGLTFEHPTQHIPISLIAPLPDYWSSVLDPETTG